MKFFLSFFLLLVLLMPSALLQAQKTLEEYEELVSQHQTQKVSDEKLTEEYGPLFRLPNKFEERKKKDWIERPKQGNGKGIFSHRGAVFTATFNNYKIEGSFTATYKGVPVIEGFAKDGTITEGTFYKLRYHMPLYSSTTPYETHLVGTYSVPVYSGTVHHVRTMAEDFIKLGTGVEYKLHNLSKYDSYYPNLYEAIYSERILPQSGNIDVGLLDGNTWYFLNKNQKPQQADQWDLFSASFIKNGKLQGEFVSANQKKYSVMTKFSDGKHSHLYRVFDKKEWDYMDFDSQQFAYQINKDEPHKTWINYYNDLEWADYLQQKQEDEEAEARRQAHLKKVNEDYWEEVKQKRLAEEERIANRWQNVGLPCGFFEMPGKPTQGENSSPKMNIGYTSEQGGGEDLLDFSIWYRYKEVVDEGSPANYLVAWSANYVWEGSLELKTLIGAQLANELYPSREYLNARQQPKNFKWSFTLDQTKKENYYTYTDANGNAVFVKTTACDGHVMARIVVSGNNDIIHHKDFKKFMTQTIQ